VCVVRWVHVDAFKYAASLHLIRKTKDIGNFCLFMYIAAYEYQSTERGTAASEFRAPIRPGHLSLDLTVHQPYRRSYCTLLDITAARLLSTSWTSSLPSVL
jgi:hypothetical protein